MSLRIETFLTSSGDSEKKQYLVLSGLKAYKDEFTRNKLYPSLSELADLYAALQDLTGEREDIQQHVPQELKDVDLQNQQLIFEPVEETDKNLDQILDLVLWAIPLVKKTLEEGMHIYNFVDEHIMIAEVGIVPIYLEEGYWFVPESRAHQLHLFRYEISLYTSANERYRTLKTRALETVEQERISSTPEEIKWMLIRKYRDLPNPATFMCETELDFPYGETILPVAKRKLMARLFS
jgi:hypothetical protein